MCRPISWEKREFVELPELQQVQRNSSHKNLKTAIDGPKMMLIRLQENGFYYMNSGQITLMMSDYMNTGNIT